MHRSSISALDAEVQMGWLEEKKLEVPLCLASKTELRFIFIP